MSTALLIALSIFVALVACAILLIACSKNIEKIDEPLFPDNEEERR